MAVNESSSTGTRAVGVVLAGGEGRRMGVGVPKALRLLAGKPLAQHVIERLRPQVEELVVVANDHQDSFRALGAGLIADVIADPEDVSQAARVEGRRLGPLAGILAGMQWASSRPGPAGWVLSAPADVPFLPRDLGQRLGALLAAPPQGPAPQIVGVRSDGQREHALALWSVALAGDLRRALIEEGLRRVEEFAGRYARADLDWPGAADLFQNINTPAELAAAERRLLQRSKR